MVAAVLSGERRKPGQKRYPVIPGHVRREVMRYASEGATYHEMLTEIDVSVGGITKILAPLGGVIRREIVTEPSTNRLCLQDRIDIYVGLQARMTYQAIADSLEIRRHRSTVWREVHRNGGREAYKPMAAQKRAFQQSRRAKPTKLALNPRLAAVVERLLLRLWSPAQIASTLQQVWSEDASMHVSHETIYKSLYVQGRGELRRQLVSCLRTGRAKRVPHGRGRKGGPITDMIMISERPAEVADRAVPGHWEGDLIIGKDGKSAVGTLVERTTRFVLLLHLDGDRTAATVREAMTTKIATLPEQLRRSLTWDQGAEMAQHQQFSIDSGMPVYFCDPHSPWQRGSNENTNGLLRQYMPKGTDLAVHSEADLDEFARSLNTRPRQTLGWTTPALALAKVVATTG